MTGMTVTEYIKCRRLSLAGQELSMKDSKVIDVALKYQYDTPESFCKAFTRFHGITPSAAKKCNSVLRCFNPIKISLNLKGGNYMNFKIEKKPAFTVIGMSRKANMGDPENIIPSLWQEYMSKHFSEVPPHYGITCCESAHSVSFSYTIGEDIKYVKNIPEGFEKIEIPELTWAVFPCTGSVTKVVPQICKEIFCEWIPSSNYKISSSFSSIEMYTSGDTSSDDYYSEIWVPVEANN